MASSAFPRHPHPEADHSFHQQDLNGLSYSLKIVQQPVRARMCGFGDKDRRNVTPAPILQLVAKTAKGDIVPTSLLTDKSFVVTADLWLDDEKTERNLVKTPAHLDAGGTFPEQHQQQQQPTTDSSLDLQAIRDDQEGLVSSTNTITARSPLLHWGQASLRHETTDRLESRKKTHPHDDYVDVEEKKSGGRGSPFDTIGLHSTGESIREAVNSLEISDFSRKRTLTSSSTSNQPALQTPDNPPASPAATVLSGTVLSTSSSPTSLGTQSSEQTLAEATTSLVTTLPPPRRALRSGRQPSMSSAVGAAATTRSSSSSRHYMSDDGDTIVTDNVCEDADIDDQPLDEYQRALRSSSRRRGQQQHQPHQTSSLSSAPSLAPSLPMTETDDNILVDEADMQGASGQYARNLVGGVVVYGQMANDLDNEPQMWFAFSTISIRTEGHFKIRFSLAEIGQPQDASPILYTMFSDVVHVQAPKKFGGTCDNNALAAHLNRQGIKVPTRKDEKKIIYRSGHDDSMSPTGQSGGGGGPSGTTATSTTTSSPS